ncbi:zinc-ribbon domain-containing protein [Ostreiculturibacter nitratireducens]|uniref:zinc-ribbon domain-containing protein n=1 Tax=Ostreiculturibacter nitratireducens TaxID=3075226 RepID=UPI0031B5CF15
MRLVCPNCGAQYEVADDVIPLAGRDVQCSACNHTWFQTRPEPVEAEEPMQAAPEAEPEIEPAEVAEEHEEAPAPVETEQQRRQLDISVLNILREEAEREARARRAEAGTIESQPDLGLAEPAAEPAPAKAEEEEVEEEEEFEPEVAEIRTQPPRETGPAPRAKMLPDIEQINSTLRADAKPDAAALAAAAAELAAKRRIGFRRGFVPVLILASVALVVYLSASRLIATFPSTEPALVAYVSKVDRARFWLDDQMRNLTARLQGEPADGGQ